MLGSMSSEWHFGLMGSLIISDSGDIDGQCFPNLGGPCFPDLSG